MARAKQVAVVLTAITIALWLTAAGTYAYYVASEEATPTPEARGLLSLLISVALLTGFSATLFWFKILGTPPGPDEARRSYTLGLDHGAAAYRAWLAEQSEGGGEGGSRGDPQGWYPRAM